MTTFKKSVYIPTVVAGAATVAAYNNAVAGRIILNGSMVYGTTVSFEENGYASAISIVSGADIRAVVFTIVGTYNGNIVTESLIGPNIATAITSNLFHTIITISINADIANPFTIGSNNNIAVMLTDSSNRNTSQPSYSVILNSLLAAAPWANGSLFIYGVTNTVPKSLRNVDLVYNNATRNSNYFYLPITGAVPVTSVPLLVLQNGLSVQTTYPYVAIIVAILGGANTTPTFIEISQS